MGTICGATAECFDGGEWNGMWGTACSLVLATHQAETHECVRCTDHLVNAANPLNVP